MAAAGGAASSTRGSMRPCGRVVSGLAHTWLRAGASTAPGHAARAGRSLLSSVGNLPSSSVRRALAAAPSVLPGSAGERAALGRSASVAATAAAAVVSDTAPTAQQHTPVNGAGGSGSSTAPTFQEAVRRLQDYWATVGCLLWLPHNTEVGAGTMNPATFLRVLGPEPWNVCYAEPSIRPDDSRYGDNPNRVQRHTQFQVILKPDPGNSQELYLGSLQALGIDTRAHDVRFVEDNWESPVLGAWGLGWEVWLDGMEVTQFTYFQQAGGRVLEAPAVEITYGLERILMALQGVKHFRDIRYNDSVTYGELFLQNEYEMSVYNMDEADVADQRRRFELFDSEARRLLEKRLPIPAYDHLLKCSHAFNILDARGAVGVTERANCFAKMRQLAREVTGLWVARREELGHPLGLIPPPAAAAAAAAAAVAVPAAEDAGATASTAPRDLVVEVGVEELPPDDVVAGMEQLRERVPALLQRLRLAHESVQVEGTPRRLAVVVKGLAARQAPEEALVKGPPAKAAFAADGSTPTKALEGFCRKNGVSPADVTRQADAKGVEYVYVLVKDEGRAAAEMLAQELPGLVGSIAFRKSMRWRGEAAFSRPIRWLLALHGDTVVPWAYAGLCAGATTRVLRNAEQPELRVPSAEAYAALLEGERITLSLSQRRQAIWDGVRAAAAAAGGCVPDSASGDLLDEVANLVESPTVVAGSFDPRFLQLPKEVLVMVMRKHQRYFPITDPATGQLLASFVAVANGPIDVAAVSAGNGAVLRARFEDAQFFYQEDLRQPLEAFRPKLGGTMFEKSLGSLLDKAGRTEALVAPLAAATGLTHALTVARQAAHLAKADLATSTVMEMTALAGTMGRHYALQQGLPADVAEAIFEAALPRQAGDQLPTSPAGILAAVADRLDSLVGLTAAVSTPSPSADPYGMRRSAYGMLQALVVNRVPMSLRAMVDAAAELQPIPVSDKARGDVVEFVTRRLEQLLEDGGCAPTTVRAVLAERGDDPALAAATVSELQAALDEGEDGAFRTLMAALSRPARIVRGKAADAAAAVDAALFELEEERALWGAYQVAAAQLAATGAPSVAEFVGACSPLVAPINAYFDRVFVMAEDTAVRGNRLAVLRELAALPRGVVDLSQLPNF